MQMRMQRSELESIHLTPHRPAAPRLLARSSDANCFVPQAYCAAPLKILIQRRAQKHSIRYATQPSKTKMHEQKVFQSAARRFALQSPMSAANG